MPPLSNFEWVARAVSTDKAKPALGRVCVKEQMYATDGSACFSAPNDTELAHGFYDTKGALSMTYSHLDDLFPPPGYVQSLANLERCQNVVSDYIGLMAIIRACKAAAVAVKDRFVVIEIGGAYIQARYAFEALNGVVGPWAIGVTDKAVVFRLGEKTAVIGRVAPRNKEPWEAWRWNCDTFLEST